MNVTNKYSLPEVFERFDRANKHSAEGADISVTHLIDSPRIRHLRAANDDQLSVDVSDMALSILGTAVHKILEEGATLIPGVIAERRYHASIDGMSISGQIDLVTPSDNGHYLLSDYKTVRAFSLQAEPAGKLSWEFQLNAYASLAEYNGVDVSGLEVIAIVRDWSASGLERSNDYPEAPIVRIPIRLWEPDRRMDYLKERVQMHLNASEDSLCSDEDKWSQKTTWAVHEFTKAGTMKKRALRVFDSHYEAMEFSMDNERDREIVERKGKSIRCEGNYCDVSEYCTQWRNEKWTRLSEKKNQ